MATGAAPALESKVNDKNGVQEASNEKPLTLKERIMQKLNKVLHHDGEYFGM
jgi:hypothetical protein